MLENSIIRAGNIVGISERAYSRYLGSLVGEAKGIILAHVAQLSGKPNAERISWGDACPYTRDMLSTMAARLPIEMESCLSDLINLYEIILHHQIITNDFPAQTVFIPLDKATMDVLLSEPIAEKTFSEYTKEIVSVHGNRILKVCEASVVQPLTGPQFVVHFSDLVDKQMEEIKQTVELCFSSYSAVMIRKINEAVVESLSGAINAD